MSVDEEYLRILNDNAYDYRGFYENNPVDAANASTHWPDAYKTVYHPTFSIYSNYSGKVSDFNPKGLTGGTWPKGPTEAREGDFQPAWWQRKLWDNTYSEGGSLTTHKPWNELSIKEKADIMRVAIRNGITNLADIRQKYNEFAEGGNLYDDGGPKTKMTADGRTLYYSTVPETGEVRWIDFDDSKDFDGVTGYRFYDDAGNKMHYTPWQDANATQEAVDAQEPSPTVEDVDNYVRVRGYDPNLTRPMWGLKNMREEGLQGVYPEFALLTGGRGLVNGAVDAAVNGINTVFAQTHTLMLE